MALTKRERNRRAFASMIKERGLTQAATAGLLHCSLDTIKAWLKPETSASSLKVPAWAPELLAFKRGITNQTLDDRLQKARMAKKRAAR